MNIILTGLVIWVILYTIFDDTIDAINNWIEEKTRKLHLENLAMEREMYGNEDDN